MTPMKKVPAANMQVINTSGTPVKEPVLSRRQLMQRERIMRNPNAMQKANEAAEKKRTTVTLPAPSKRTSPSAPSSGRAVGTTMSAAEAKAMGLGLAKGGAVAAPVKRSVPDYAGLRAPVMARNLNRAKIRTQPLKQDISEDRKREPKPAKTRAAPALSRGNLRQQQGIKGNKRIRSADATVSGAEANATGLGLAKGGVAKKKTAVKKKK